MKKHRALWVIIIVIVVLAAAAAGVCPAWHRR